MGLSRVFLTEYYVLVTLYNRFGPLGVLCRLSGQFPVHATISGDHILLRFSLCSVATLYSFLIQGLPLIKVFFLYQRIQVGIDAMLKIVTTTIFMVYTPQILIHMENWASVFQHLQDVDVFDSQLYNVPLVTTREELVKNYFLILGPFFQISSCCFASQLNNTKIDIDFNLIRIMLYLPSIMQTSLFLVLCQQMSHRTCHFQKSWIKYLRIAVTQNLDQTALRLDSYRSLHGKLLKCSASLNSAFGIRLTVLCVFLQYILIVCSYVFLKDLLPLYLTVQVVVPYILLIFVGLFASNLHTSSHVVLDQMFDLRICGLNRCLRTQMDILAYQLYLSKMNVSVPGLFVFSRKFVGSFVIVLVSYFIVVTQVT